MMYHCKGSRWPELSDFQIAKQAAAFAHQITIDLCILVAVDKTCATLAMAVLDLPRIVVAWRPTGRPYDAVLTAMLIADALDAAGDDAKPARIAGCFGNHATHAVIEAELARAGIMRVCGTPPIP